MNELESVKKSLEQIAKSNAEAAVWRALADKRHAKVEKEMAKLTQAMRETRKEMGGMSNTQGRTTEEFFLQALDKDRRLGALEFGHIRPNVRAYDCGQEAEFDILMMNGEVVAVIEVKHTLRREDVKWMREWTLPSFRRFLPEYDDKTLAPAMACIIAKRDALALAYQYGYAVLRPGGQRVHADVSHLRCLPKRHKTPAG